MLMFVKQFFYFKLYKMYYINNITRILAHTLNTIEYF